MEFVVACQGREPQGQFAEFRRELVAVDAVETTLHDEPLGMEQQVFVGRHLRADAVGFPGPYQRLGELPAGFDEKGAGAHRRVEHLQGQDLFRRRARAEPFEDRAQRLGDDRLGQRARRVM